MFFWFFAVAAVAFVAGSFTSSWFKNEEIKALNEIIAIRNKVVPPKTPKA